MTIPDAPSPRRLKTVHDVRPTRAARTVLCGALLALLGGCAVGPDFRAPVLPQEAGYRADAVPTASASADTPTGDAQRFLQGEDVPAQWWTSFANDEINRRVEQALANSPTVASAQAALRQRRKRRCRAAACFLRSTHHSEPTGKESGCSYGIAVHDP
jgi:hypothetical protein